MNASEPALRRTANGGRRPSLRNELLEAAIELFAKEGSRGTPLSAIAERIGVTTPAITHHFGTKQALLMEVVQAVDQDDRARLAPGPVRHGLERLAAAARWGELLETDPSLANLSRLRTVMFAEALDPDFTAHEHFVRRHRRFRRRFVQFVRQGQRDGSIRADANPKTTASEVMAFIQGAQLQWLLDPQDVDLRQMFGQYFDRLVRDLAAPDAEEQG